MRLLCEVQYASLLKVGESETEFTEKSRVDLCVCGPVVKDQDPLKKLLFAFEVKRGSAPKAAIDNDLRRLLEVKRTIPSVRAFLLLISERKRPGRFVDAGSFAIRRKQSIPESDGHCYVRAVLKAVPAVTSLDHAHYACAIEVLPD